MRVCIINNLELPAKIEPCDVVLLINDPIPFSLKSSPVTASMWLARDFINWVLELPCTNCIGCYFAFSEIDTTILDRVHKLTKFRFDIIQDKEFNIITENEVCKFWLGKDFKSIPKRCDLIVVNDIPDEKTLTQTRKKTFGNIELATIIKERLPLNVVYPSDNTAKLDIKKNCITKFATVADIIYIDV